MIIKDVELIYYPDMDRHAFQVDVEGLDANVSVPNDPLNADYHLVKEWYAKQETKPFNFEFVG